MESSEASEQELLDIFKYLRDGDYPSTLLALDINQRRNGKKNLKKKAKRYQLSQDRTELLLPRKSSRKPGAPETQVKVVIGQSERQRIIQSIHAGAGESIESTALGGHLGRDKTISKVAERYYWPNYTDDIRRYCSMCHSCQVANTRFSKATPVLHPVAVPNEPWVQIGVDLCSLPESNDGFKYFAIAVDYFSKWVEAEPMKTKDAADVAWFLYKLCCRLGAVKIQINDQGREFVNAVSAQLHALTGVKQRVTSAYHPQANGLAERNNRTVQNCLLKTLQKDHTQWARALPGVVSAYNTSCQKSTGYSPHYLMYGRQARLFMEMESGEESECDMECAEPVDDDVDAEMFAERLQKIKQVENAMTAALQKKEEQRSAARDAAMQNILKSQTRQKHDYERRNTRQTTFNVGDEVLKWNNQRHDRKGGKMTQLPWSGPYIIHSVTKRNTYRICKPDTDEPLKTAVPGNQLKKYMREKSKRPAEADSAIHNQPKKSRCDSSSDDEVKITGQYMPENGMQFCPVDAAWQDKMSSEFITSGLSTRVHHNKVGPTKKVARTQRPERGARITGDGNCFFRTLSHVVFGHQREHAYLRERFGRYLETNQDATFHFTNDDTFIDHTLRPREWSTETHIALSAAWLGTSIHVWHGQSQQWLAFPRSRSGFQPLSPTAGSDQKCIYIINEHDHYEPVYSM